MGNIRRRGIMKFLLTSSGISNNSIRTALVDLLGKPIAESSALVIPTAWYAYPGGIAGVYRLIAGVAHSPFCDLGWKSIGVLELTALPTIRKENWVPLVQEVDALLIGGGEVFYLCYWMWQSGLADLLPTLRPEAVYVGLSGGSMVVTPPIGVYDDPQLHDPELRESRSDKMLGLVDFTLLPHLGNPDLPDHSLAEAQKWAAGIPIPAYAIDDQTAIKVVDGVVDVISEGHWRLFPQE
jgi:dipeptidase E